MKILKRTFLIFFLLLIILLSFIFYSGYKTYKDVLKESSLTDKINNIRSNKHYTYLSDVTPNYKNAIIAIEDHRFYEHNGIDIISTIRAIIANIKEKSLSQGGSTITQQVTKNLYLTRRKKIYSKSN